MSTLRIFLFGSVRIAHGEDLTAGVKLTHTVQELLAYLLLQQHRWHAREVLTEVAWGDRPEDQARSCLNTALWRLRRALEPDGIARGTYLVTTSSGEVSFNWESDHWIDVAAFEGPVRRILARPVQVMEAVDAVELENALQLYCGELLDGFYTDWALRDRERLRSIYLDSLAHLLNYSHDRGNYAKSLTLGKLILDQDPLREEIHREMMRLYMQVGQRALAVRQYQSCRGILAKELGIAPMEETEAVYHQIVSEAQPSRDQLISAQEQTTLWHALRQLHAAWQEFEQTRAKFQRAMCLVKELAEREKNHIDKN